MTGAPTKESNAQECLETCESSAGPEAAAAEAPEEREAQVPAGEENLEQLTREELIAKLEALRQEVAKNYDLYLRSQAEMENIKKRFARDKQDLARYANENLIKDLLPIVDNLQKALEHGQEGDSLPALREGIELTLRGLLDTLKKAGLEEVKALGEAFDPSFHEAVSVRVDPNQDAGRVVEELQKGYLLNNRLIRPSMVVVSQNSA